MIEIPKWNEALDQFNDFLRSCSHSTEIEWVFREDIWRRGVQKILIRHPVPPNNVVFCRRVFEAGRRKGLVELVAIGRDEATTFSTAWYPMTPDEEIQGWDQGMKLAMVNPLARVKRVSHFVWPVFKVLPRFRQYQRFEEYVPTRSRYAT